MSAKAVIALIFGLVFQLSQVMPGMTAAMTDCAPVAHACECCAGFDSCPCAKEGEPARKPLPSVPDSGQNLKAPLAKVTGTRVSPEGVSGRHPAPSDVAATPITGPWTGYTGVPLSVAFCSFVI